MRLADFRSKITETAGESEFVGGVYPCRHLSILASPAGIGKTWVLLKQAIDLAVGGKFFGGDIFKGEPGKTLYFVGEAGADIMRERFDLMQKPEGVDYENLISMYCIDDFVIQNISIYLNNDAGKKNIDAIIAGEKPKLVIIDTLIAFQCEDESSVESTTATLNFLKAEAVKHNCAIVIAHHTRKGDKKQPNHKLTQDDIIGSSAIVRLCACAFILHISGTRVKTLECVKSWYRKPEPTSFIIANNNSQIELREEKEVSDTTKRENCIKTWNELPDGSMIDIAHMASRSNCSNTLAREVLQVAAAKGKAEVITIRNRNWYRKKALEG